MCADSDGQSHFYSTVSVCVCVCAPVFYFVFLLISYKLAKYIRNSINQILQKTSTSSVVAFQLDPFCSLAVGCFCCCCLSPLLLLLSVVFFSVFAFFYSFSLSLGEVTIDTKVDNFKFNIPKQ